MKVGGIDIDLIPTLTPGQYGTVDHRKVKPIRDKVLLRRLDAEPESKIIQVVKTAKRPNSGVWEVVALGTGIPMHYKRNGKTISEIVPFPFKVGDVVYTPAYEADIRNCFQSSADGLWYGVFRCGNWQAGDGPVQLALEKEE